MTVDRLGENRYYVRPPYVMEGTYALEGTRLTRLSEDRLDGETKPESDLPAREAFAWQVRGPYMLTLVDDPESRSHDYAGATLFRPREIGQGGNELPKKGQAPEAEATDAEGPAKPSAIDIQETELDVRLFPGRQATRLPSGDLQFAMTVRNDSKETIEFGLPHSQSEESSVLARVRIIEPAPADGSESPTLLLPVYRTGPETESPTVVVRAGERAKLDIRLDWEDAAKASNRRLPQERKYEILLTMTFLAEGELQHLTGPRGSVVAIDLVQAVR